MCVCVCVWVQGYKVCHLILGLYYSQCLATQTPCAPFTLEDFLLLRVTLTLPFYHSIDSIAQTDSTHTQKMQILVQEMQFLNICIVAFSFVIGYVYFSILRLLIPNIPYHPHRLPQGKSAPAVLAVPLSHVRHLSLLVFNVALCCPIKKKKVTFSGMC